MDPEDYDRLNKYKWHVVRGNNTYYAGRNARIGKKRISIKMHREVIHPPDHLFADHINRNGWDNRKANLRPATRAQNTLNRSLINTKPSSSKYNGVSWSKSQKKWHAQLGLNGKYKFLGYFHDEIKAARAYDEAAKKYHGDFAVLNFQSQ